ncbi:MAG: sensor histidine kinase [Vicinamibacterales bacterium]
MTLLNLVFLFVYVFGAYAYGAATLLTLRSRSAVLALPRENTTGSRLGRPSLALFGLSTIWFVLMALREFERLAGQTAPGMLDVIGLVLGYLFPPLIMHMVYSEVHCEGESRHAPLEPGGWRRPVVAAYLVWPPLGLYLAAAVLGLAPLPPAPGAVIGFSISLAFVLASVYSTAVMFRSRPVAHSPRQRRTRATMTALFVFMVGLTVVLLVLQDAGVAAALVERLMRTAPLYFLIASAYLENRFEFYDLVVKRGVMLLASLVTVGVALAAAMPWLGALPEGPARPWLFAVTLVPVALFLPWLHGRLAAWLDRIWFGREFSPVDAVKHVLSGMQPATDEASLVAATETRLSEIFGMPVAVLVEDRQAPAGEVVDTEVMSPTPVSRTPVRFAVLRRPDVRPLLSEDLGLLRSLASVFGFMLENVRLQHRRLEQEQVAQALRLQSSRSELKALRAQINPHFLFNALNAIASLIHTDPARADRAVEQLAEVFRYTLRRSEQEWAPLDQEIAFARAYLDVEQARFGDRLHYEVITDEVTLPGEEAPAWRGVQVPAMVLQTLVENAVKHGISRARGRGRLEVRAQASGDQLVLEVRNTGPEPGAAGAAAGEGEGFGLRSVHDRLRGHFGELATLTLTRDRAGEVTIARVVMPRVGVHA